MAASENRDSFGRLAYILVKFSLPLMLSGILQQLYNWADAFIVGNVVGELALAAVGSTTSMVNFYVLAITGFTLGLSILFAQKFGARRPKLSRFSDAAMPLLLPEKNRMQ